MENVEGLWHDLSQLPGLHLANESKKMALQMSWLQDEACYRKIASTSQVIIWGITTHFLILNKRNIPETEKKKKDES